MSVGKRKITCNNSSCKHHTNGGCDTCITLDGSGKYYKALYDQAGNSIAVPIFESIFRKIILHEVA